MATTSWGTARLAAVAPALPAQRPTPGNRVLVPLIRGQSAAFLLSIGDAVAEQCPSRGIVLSLVEIPSRWSGMVASAVVRSRELLRWIAATDYASGAEQAERLGIQSRFTADPAASIREALLETQCDVVLAELPPIGRRRRHRLEAILRSLSDHPDVNLIVARPDPATSHLGIRPTSVLVPLRGGPNARLALAVALAVASRTHARLTLLHVYDPTHHEDLRAYEAATFRELANAAGRFDPEILEIVSRNPAEAIYSAARNRDMVVMGAHANPSRTGMLIGYGFSSLINRLTQTVILARAASDFDFAA